MERLQYHFEPQKGWINDPNGLIQYGGKYHAFFQHNPYSAHWDTMHWGHAVSEDLLHWQELPIALFPDQPYENAGGCYSGSAVEKDGKLYLFYTSVSHEMKQTQSVAVSEDGVNFTKYAGNPVIPHYPPEGSAEFRDPKVTFLLGSYYMVCGSGKDKVGKVLLYRSDDLLAWDYVGVLYENAEYGPVMECPDFFALDGKFVLMFSRMGMLTHSTIFITGDFDGKTFTPEQTHMPEIGPHFYAPQTFEDAAGRRVLIGWMSSWGREPDEDAEYAGALTIPRAVTLQGGKLYTYPVAEAAHLLADSDEAVQFIPGETEISVGGTALDCPPIADVKILRDGTSVELFINGGESSVTAWID